MPNPLDLPPEPIAESDKHEHALSGAAIRFGLEDLNAPPLAALLGPIAVGILKERFDARDQLNHTVDPEDAVSTVLGALGAYRNRGFTLVPTISRDRIAIDGILRF